MNINKLGNGFIVVLPSYNETKNVSISIKRIRSFLPLSKIIIVDDSPIDKNKELRDSIKKYKKIELISRYEKKGRGTAVIEGLKSGLKDKKNKYFFEMDSDLAQDPGEFKNFINKMAQDKADVVIGSRYIPGGGAKGVSKSRVILSVVINKFLYFLLRVKITDYTDGFRLYNRRAVEILSKEKIESTGFITLTEIIFKLNRKGIKISEVPVIIYNREYGASTRNLKELTVSLWFVLKMKISYLGK